MLIWKRIGRPIFRCGLPVAAPNYRSRTNIPDPRPKPAFRPTQARVDRRACRALIQLARFQEDNTLEPQDHRKRLKMDLPFLPVNIALLTVSDSRDLDNDRSGDTLEKMITEDGHRIVRREVRKDEVSLIQAFLEDCIADSAVDVVITTGGTGVTGRDVTPEAFKGVMEKEIEGFGELFRWISFAKIGTSTMQSRALGGVANGTYLFALPGSPGACKDGWGEILRWQLDNRHMPCNLVDLMPRLNEHLQSAG